MPPISRVQSAPPTTASSPNPSPSPTLSRSSWFATCLVRGSTACIRCSLSAPRRPNPTGVPPAPSPPAYPAPPFPQREGGAGGLGYPAPSSPLKPAPPFPQREGG